MSTDRVSGGRIMQALIRGPSLRVRWSRARRKRSKIRLERFLDGTPLISKPGKKDNFLKQTAASGHAVLLTCLRAGSEAVVT
jgi:hypothetical protein